MNPAIFAHHHHQRPTARSLPAESIHPPAVPLNTRRWAIKNGSPAYIGRGATRLLLHFRPRYR